ncbi:MAG: alpha/beta hydrolase [Acidobacteria bacterium]|nr:alpha/beta hydrolase [Acidobacteriota bacterium]
MIGFYHFYESDSNGNGFPDGFLLRASRSLREIKAINAKHSKEDESMYGLSEWKNGGEFFDYKGFPIFYRQSGPRPDTLLCLHGFPTASFDYRKIWSELEKAFTVVTLDLIGYGFSAKPYDFDYTTFVQADVVEAFLKNLNAGRVHILAHDYGNTITQELLARRHEGRLGFEIGSICFLNGALFPETHRPILAQKLLISPIGKYFGRFIPDSRFAASLASIFGPGTKPTADELADHVALFKYNEGKLIAHKLIRYMTERAKYRERWVEPLQNMTQPFLFINGSFDPVSGKHLVERFRQLVPDQENIVELPGIGHFPHVESPDEILTHFLRFLGRKDGLAGPPNSSAKP